jgi:outer membrane protein assembly factor BamB
MSAMTRARMTLLGVVGAAVLVLTADGPGTGTAPTGCAAGPARPAPAGGAGTGRVHWSAAISPSHEVYGRSSIGPLLYVPTSVPPSAEQREHDNRVTAFDPSDGREAWRQGGVLDGVDGVTGSVHVSGVNGSLLMAIEPIAGQWRWAHIADDGGTGIQLAPGGMHVASAPGVLVAYREGDSPGYLTRVDPGQGTSLWTLAEPPYAIREAILRGDTIYLDSVFHTVAEHGFELSAVDVSTGQTRWRRVGTEPINLGATTLAEQDGRLAAILSSEVPDGPSSLVMIDSRTGTDLWSRVLGGYVYPYEHAYLELTAHGALYSYAGRLTMYNAATGAIRWVLETGARPENRERNRSHAPGLIRLAPGALLIAGDDHVSCVDPATGAVRWRTYTGVPFVNDVRVAGNVVYAFGLRDPGGEDSAPMSYMMALDLQTGNQLWRYERTGTAMSLLACKPDAVFVFGEHTVQRIGP